MKSSTLVRTVLIISCVLLGGLLLISGSLWSWPITAGIGIGGALMISNLLIIRATIAQSLANPNTTRARRRVVGVFLAKSLVWVLVLALALRSGLVHILGLIAGCSVVVGAILLTAPFVYIVGLVEE